MEVECVKYRERMDSEQAECRHPGDYCKFRSSCIIHFLGGVKKKEGAVPSTNEADAPGTREESKKQ
ncbi:MAG: RNA polymerase II-associated protein [Desulfobulbaceae bacterium]